MQAMKEMPKYKCHKVVYALKIASVTIEPNNAATILPKEEGFASFTTKPGWSMLFKAHVEADDLGYYVVYEDGYESWSPSDAFESGYSRV